MRFLLPELMSRAGATLKVAVRVAVATGVAAGVAAGVTSGGISGVTSGVVAPAANAATADATATAGAALGDWERAGPARAGRVLERRLEAGETLRLEFELESGATLTALVRSEEIDPLLHSLDADHALILADDNGGPGLAARLTVTGGADGRLRLLIANSYPDSGGDLRLELHPAGAEFGADRPAFVRAMRSAAAAGDDRLLLDALRGYVSLLSRAVGPDSALAKLRQPDHADFASVAAHDAAPILRDLATTLIEIAAGRYRPALAAGERARDAAREEGREVLLGFAHLLLGTTHLVRNDPDIALLELERAIPLLDRNHQLDLAARVRYQAGRALLQSDLERAVTLFGEAISRWYVRGDLPRAALAAVDRGTALRYMGRGEEATREFVRAAQWTERGGDRATAGAALTALGETYRCAAQFDRAATVLRRALDCARQTGVKSQAVATLLELARLARARGDYGVAIDNAELAHSLAQQASTPYQYIAAEIVLGNLALRLDDFAAAERFLAEAGRLGQLYDHDDLTVEAGGRMAKLAVARRQPDRAVGPLVNAEREFGEAGRQEARTDMQIALAGMTATTGRLAAAESDLRVTEQAIRRLPGAPGLLRLRAMRGRILREQGRFAASLQEIEAALAELPADDHQAGRRLHREHARTLIRLQRDDDAIAAHMQAIDHLLAAPPAGELGFEDGVLHESREFFDEVIDYLADLGRLDRAFELSLLASEVEHRARWSARAAGLDRVTGSAPRAALVRPELESVRAAVDARGVTLIAHRVTAKRFLSWVVPAPGGLGAIARHVVGDSLVLWNARLLDSLTAGHVPHGLTALREQIWAPIEAWVAPERPVLMIPDLALGHLPLEIMTATGGRARAAGGVSGAAGGVSGAAGDVSGAAGGRVGTELRIAYATHPGNLIAAGAPAPTRPAGGGRPQRLAIAYRPELTPSDSRRERFIEWGGDQGLDTRLAALDGDRDLHELVGAGGRIIDLSFPCHVTRSKVVRSGLILTDAYRSPIWSAVSLGADNRIPGVVEDGRLTADEVRAAEPAPVDLVTLRILCIEGDARPSGTIVEAFLAAGADAVLLPRWGSLGDPAATDALLREVYQAVLAGTPADAALRLARQRDVARGGAPAASGSWGVFIAP